MRTTNASPTCRPALLLVGMLAGICPAVARCQVASQPTCQPATTQSAGQRAPLQEVMNRWIDGRQEQAIQQFLAIDWDNLRFGKDSIFSRKESDLTDMSQARWQMLAEDALEASRTLRQICKQVVAQADQLAFEKQYQQAERMLQAVRKCGRAVAPPDSLAILRATGVAIQKQALQKLISLYEGTGQTDRIAACQAALEDLEAQFAALREEARKAPAKAMERAQHPAAERVAGSQPAK